jgi:ABC-2 type transport system ATP-binding protein
VLDHVDLDVAEGAVFGFLGPNGAGKTTLIKILIGLAMPNGGAVTVFGEDLFQARRRLMRQVGAVVEAPVFYEYMSAWDNLRYLVSLSGGVSADRLAETLHTVGLGDVRDQKVGTFSYGMKQRLGIAQALLPGSRFLILDEPTNGLDPHGIAGMRDLLRRLSREHRITVFLSSHLLHEVEQVCDHIAIVHRGRKVYDTETDPAPTQAGPLCVDIEADASLAVALTDMPCPPPAVAEAAEGRQTLSFRVEPDEVPTVVRELAARGARIHAVRPPARRLEQLFIELTGGEDADGRIDTFRS